VDADRSIVVVVVVSIDFVSDDAADNCTANRARGAAVGQQCSADCAGAGSDRRIAIAFRHIRARECGEQQRGDRDSHSNSSNIHIHAPLPWLHDVRSNRHAAAFSAGVRYRTAMHRGANPTIRRWRNVREIWLRITLVARGLLHFLQRTFKVTAMKSNFIRTTAITLASIAVVGLAGCEIDSTPKQVHATNPTVSYRYHDDRDLVQANEQAQAYCSRYQSVPTQARFQTDANGDRVVVFDCVAAATVAAPVGVAPYPAAYPRSDMTYTYRSDEEFMANSRTAQSYCASNGMTLDTQTIVENHDGTKTVTFQCRRT
jgi:hypothetical protein